MRARTRGEMQGRRSLLYSCAGLVNDINHLFKWTARRMSRGRFRAANTKHKCERLSLSAEDARDFFAGFFETVPLVERKRSLPFLGPATDGEEYDAGQWLKTQSRVGCREPYSFNEPSDAHPISWGISSRQHNPIGARPAVDESLFEGDEPVQAEGDTEPHNPPVPQELHCSPCKWRRRESWKIKPNPSAPVFALRPVDMGKNIIMQRFGTKH